MRLFKHLLPLLLTLAFLCSCNSTGDPGDTPVTGSDAEHKVSTEYVDPSAPADGGIKTDSDTPGQILDYFAEIAFGSEYGNSPMKLCRWESEIVYHISGSPTDADIELIGIVVDRLNTVDNFPGMKKTDDPDKANFEIMFITRDEIMAQFENANETCKGMSEFHWYTKTNEIFKARAAIDCEAVEERESTVCEEIMQALGIAKDSFQHRDSVFYQGTCNYRRPSELDYTIVEILYSPKLSPGMDRHEAIVAAAGILGW